MTEKVDFDLAENVEQNPLATVDKPVAPEDMVPKYGSPEWNDYVLTLLTEDEKPNGCPTCAGLRRIVEDLLGEIVFSGPVQVFPSSESNDIGRATVNYEIVFAWKIGIESYVDLSKFEYPTKTFRDVGEAWKGNTPDPFAVHAAASASTKAESRVLKKALKLKVLTAEEASINDILAQKDKELEDNSLASSFQKSFIESKCNALSINKDKFLNKSVTLLTHSEAVKLLEQINGFIQDKTTIPEEIKL